MINVDQIKSKFILYDELVSFIVELEEKNYDILQLDLEIAKELKSKCQNLYDQLIDLHFAVAKFIYINNLNENQSIVFKQDISLTPKQVLVFSEKRANVIQFKYLYPLNIRLNEFAEQEAIIRENESEKRGNRRDIKFFLLGIFIGFLPEFASPWIKYCFPVLEPPIHIEQAKDTTATNSMIQPDLVSDTLNTKMIDTLKKPIK